MATQKVTDLAAYSSIKTTDTYHVVDTTDTSQDPAGSSYKVTWATLKTAILAFFSAGTGITFSGGVISSDPTATQTFTNKTLTSPVINTPTITSPALTVGSDATGDLYYRSSGGFTRLPVGSTNNLLQVIGGVPSWQSLSIPTLYNNYVADTGSANAYAIAPSPAIGSYATGQVFIFKAANTNTGASTINVNSLGTKSLVRAGGAALNAGDILAGQIVVCAYDGTNVQMSSPSANTSANKLAIDVTGASVSATTTETTVFTTSVPANILSSANAIRLRLYLSAFQANAITQTIRLKYGSTTIISKVSVGTGASSYAGVIEFLLAANASTSAQKGEMYLTLGVSDSSSTNPYMSLASGTSAEDSTTSLNLVVTVQASSSSGGNIVVDKTVAEIIHG